MGIDPSSLGMDPWTASYIANMVREGWPFVTFCMASLLAAVWFFRLYRRGTHPKLFFIGTVALGAPSIGFLVIIALSIVAEREVFDLAREFGVPPPPAEGYPIEYPFQARLAAMTAKPTGEEEVHELLRSAKILYECRLRDKQGNLSSIKAEKYLFFKRNLIINVFYDYEGFVTEAGTWESIDPVPLADCGPPQRLNP